MFGKLAALEALMPQMLEKFKMKKTDLKTPEEFKAALLNLNAGAGANAERFMVEGEFKGRPAVAILVLK